jgi:hypothetical protein
MFLFKNRCFIIDIVEYGENKFKLYHGRQKSLTEETKGYFPWFSLHFRFSLIRPHLLQWESGPYKRGGLS